MLDFDLQAGGRFEPWLEVRRSVLLQAVESSGGHVEEGQKLGLFAARGFRHSEPIGVYVGVDLGEVDSWEADAATRALNEAGVGRHLLVRGYGRRARVIDGRRGFSGLQFANSGRGLTGWADNTRLGGAGTLTALRDISVGDELTFEYDQEGKGGYWAVHG